ncbi:MAG TPA: NAD(P)/FAD-dependent oxidoreductase [Steroidobacteraceae bacterium]|nr:NAD(P)/FAD-dependent oxidoreductase [Steroidobacteraceae bacterium]
MQSSSRVTIVGAGPAGSLLGILLARRGLPIAVYERRLDMRRESISAGRSINLALADRGIHALAHAGVLDAVRPLMIPMRGRMIHDEAGRTSLQRYGQDDTEVIHSVSRAELNKLLLTELERIAGIDVRFHHNCRGVDFHADRLRFLDESDGQPKDVPAAPLIAADGASSAIRAAMLADGRTRVSEEVLSHRYKELTVPAGPGGRHRMETHALHIWPRGGYMLIALPNVDGSFTATLFLPAEGPESFATLATKDAVRQFFARRFADAQALMPDLSDEFFAHPTGTMVTVRAAPWKYADKALLIGDAAHAIVPFHGQGMNCAFEDCVALDRALDRYEDWGRVFARVDHVRKPNADAIAQMALENYVEMRDSVRDPRFVLQKELSLQLEQRFPGQFIPRYSMVMFHHEIPYSLALERGRIQQEILNDLTVRAAGIDQVDWSAATKLVETRLPEL